MGAREALDIGTEAIYVLLEMSLPVLLIALIVGLIISLFQALTQIQEMTLSFVPKIVAIAFSLILFLPMMGEALTVFAEELFQRIGDMNSAEVGTQE